MFGNKSKLTKLIVPNLEVPNQPHIVMVQANKNNGICDIVLGNMVPEERINPKTGKKTTFKKFAPSRRVNEIFTDFQGRQYDDPYVIEHLVNILKVILS